MAEDRRLKGGCAAVHTILRGKERRNYARLSELVTPWGQGGMDVGGGRCQRGRAGLLCTGNESPDRPRDMAGTRSIDNFKKLFNICFRAGPVTGYTCIPAGGQYTIAWLLSPTAVLTLFGPYWEPTGINRDLCAHRSKGWIRSHVEIGFPVTLFFLPAATN